MTIGVHPQIKGYVIIYIDQLGLYVIPFASNHVACNNILGKFFKESYYDEKLLYRFYPTLSQKTFLIGHNLSRISSGHTTAHATVAVFLLQGKFRNACRIGSCAGGAHVYTLPLSPRRVNGDACPICCGNRALFVPVCVIAEDDSEARCGVMRCICLSLIVLQLHRTNYNFSIVNRRWWEYNCL